MQVHGRILNLSDYTVEDFTLQEESIGSWLTRIKDVVKCERDQELHIPETFMGPSVSKELMADWLADICSHFYIQKDLLSKAKKDIDVLKTAIIESLEEVIVLKEELLACKEEQLNSVKAVLENTGKKETSERCKVKRAAAEVKNTAVNSEISKSAEVSSLKSSGGLMKVVQNAVAQKKHTQTTSGGLMKVVEEAAEQKKIQSQKATGGLIKVVGEAAAQKKMRSQKALGLIKVVDDAIAQNNQSRKATGALIKAVEKAVAQKKHSHNAALTMRTGVETDHLCESVQDVQAKQITMNDHTSSKRGTTRSNQYRSSSDSESGSIALDLSPVKQIPREQLILEMRRRIREDPRRKHLVRRGSVHSVDKICQEF